MKRVRLYAAAFVATVIGCGIAALCAKSWQGPTPVQTTKTPTAEDVGRKAGGAAVGFGKGFIEGAKDRLKGAK